MYNSIDSVTCFETRSMSNNVTVLRDVQYNFAVFCIFVAYILIELPTKNLDALL